MKYFPLPIIIFIITSLCNFASAQTGKLTGMVKGPSGEPLRDVHVYLSGMNKGTSTDGLGKFLLGSIPVGKHELVVSSVGYEAQTISTEILENEVTNIVITLETGDVLLSDVVITDQLQRQSNYISPLDIQLRPTNTSQDILRMVPGLFIAQHAGGGKAEQIFLRGFDIDHGTDINLEVDGLPVNMVSHAHGQGYSDLHFVIPEMVSLVDFNKGPYYAHKGNFTTAGYASFHTKNSLDKNMVKAEGGRFGTFRNVNAINLINRTGDSGSEYAYVASEFFRSDGYFESNQNFNRINLMGKYNRYFNDGHLLTLGLSTFRSRWDASGQIPERAVDNGMITRFGAIDDTEGGETSRTNIYIRSVHPASTGLFDNQLYFSRYDFHLVSNFTFFLNNPVFGDQITQSESRNIYGYRGSYTHQSQIGQMDIQSEVGAGFRYDDINDSRLSNTLNRKSVIGDMARGDVDETNLHAYISETIILSPGVTFNAAVRLDHFTFNYVNALTPEYTKQSVSKAFVSPKVNLSYDINPSTNFFLKGGIGFHSNDTRVVVAQEGREILPKAIGADLGGTFRIGNRIILGTTLWVLKLDQEFVYVGDAGIVEPGGRTLRKGLDLSLRYQVNDWLFLDSDVNATDPEALDETEDEDHIPLAPVLSSIGGFTFQFKDGLSAGLRYRYLADRPANESNTLTAEGYFLADAVVKYTRPSFEISVTAENLLNMEWKEAQFETESRLSNEAEPVSEIHFTPGTPFFIKAGVSFFF